MNIRTSTFMTALLTGISNTWKTPVITRLAILEGDPRQSRTNHILAIRRKRADSIHRNLRKRRSSSFYRPRVAAPSRSNRCTAFQWSRCSSFLTKKVARPKTRPCTPRKARQNFLQNVRHWSATPQLLWTRILSLISQVTYLVSMDSKSQQREHRIAMRCQERHQLAIKFQATTRSRHRSQRGRW